MSLQWCSPGRPRRHPRPQAATSTLLRGNNPPAPAATGGDGSIRYITNARTAECDDIVMAASVTVASTMVASAVPVWEWRPFSDAPPWRPPPPPANARPEAQSPAATADAVSHTTCDTVPLVWVHAYDDHNYLGSLGISVSGGVVRVFSELLRGICRST